MLDQLQACIENFGPAPRTFSMWDRLKYLPLPKPPWLRSHGDDRLQILFDYAEEVFRDGVVVWGYMVQANVLMFRPGRDNCGGLIVYSLDNPQTVAPAELQRVARALYSLKDTKPEDPDVARVAAMITGERARVYGYPVPSSLSPTTCCKISSTFFVRKHLPDRKLTAPLFPIVVNPEVPHVAIPLPAKYWPEALIEWWGQ